VGIPKAVNKGTFLAVANLFQGKLFQLSNWQVAGLAGGRHLAEHAGHGVAGLGHHVPRIAAPTRIRRSSTASTTSARFAFIGIAPLGERLGQTRDKWIVRPQLR
jgi:hypothetical protein